MDLPGNTAALLAKELALAGLRLLARWWLLTFALACFVTAMVIGGAS